MHDERSYSIQEVGEHTGIPVATLRQWERRYAFPLPERLSNGYRLYSQTDIEQLALMKRYLEDGMPPSRASQLIKNQWTQPHQSNSLTSFPKR